MRYPQGGGLTAEWQAFREHIRLQAAELFAAGQGNAAVARELRVSVRSVQRWGWAWEDGEERALASKGPLSRLKAGAGTVTVAVHDASPSRPGRSRWTRPGRARTGPALTWAVSVRCRSRWACDRPALCPRSLVRSGVGCGTALWPGSARAGRGPGRSWPDKRFRASAQGHAARTAQPVGWNAAVRAGQGWITRDTLNALKGSGLVRVERLESGHQLWVLTEKGHKGVLARRRVRARRRAAPPSGPARPPAATACRSRRPGR